MYTRSRGAAQHQTNFVRGPTLNAQGQYQGANNSPYQQQQQQQQQQQGQAQGQVQVQQQQTPKVNQAMRTPMQTPQKPQQQQQQTPLKPVQQQQQTPQKPIPQQPLATPKAPAENQINAQPTPVSQPANQENSMEFEEGSTQDGLSETSDQPRWKRSKLLGVKPNRKLRRQRMNQRLRKTLMPKNAIMVLNEMKAGVQFVFPETQPVSNSLFLVHAELDGKTYVGQGLSKPLARQNAAENALKCLLLEKMTAAANKVRTESEGEAQPAPEATPATPVQPPQEGGEGETAATPMTVDESDDIPWSSLASFALYKLFLEWQTQGTVVPIPRPGVQTPPKVKVEAKPVVEKELPANPLSIHPVMLLNQMKPGTTYVEISRTGNPPNTLFTLSVEIDGKVYNGTAKNKKDAKKTAAKEALRAMYNLEYPEEETKNGIEPMQTTPQ